MSLLYPILWRYCQQIVVLRSAILSTKCKEAGRGQTGKPPTFVVGIDDDLEIGISQDA
ncbi:MAG TPA: hypothetical protein VE130_14070 [Nitrososphaeraceae archaeon]|nr:hypothetical protein [Nitrososphaeraceae archaeon]